MLPIRDDMAPRRSRSRSPESSRKRSKPNVSYQRDESPTRRHRQGQPASAGDSYRRDSRDYRDRDHRDYRDRDHRDHRDRDRDYRRRSRSRDYDDRRRRSRSHDRDRPASSSTPAALPTPAPGTPGSSTPQHTTAPGAAATPPVEDEKQRLKRERLEAWKKQREAAKALDEAKAKALALAGKSGAAGACDFLFRFIILQLRG